MKRIFTLFTATFFTACLTAQVTTVGSSKTAITTEVTKSNPIVSTPIVPTDGTLTLKESEYDFGKIPQGKPVTHIFDVMNKGKDSLKIVNVQASCGCTTPEWERNIVVAPGGNTKITVGYNAAGAGPFSKFITITYNGTQSKQMIIKGEVWQTPASSAPENNNTKELKNN